MRTITLRFVRPPDNVNNWVHEFIFQDEDVIVSGFRFEGLKKPFVVSGKVAVENGYKGTCYEFVRKGLEVINVEDLEGRPKGYYCNINTLPKLFEGGYEVTDLFLDVWVFPDLEHAVLDRDEFEDALRKGIIGEKERKFAEKVLKDLLADIEKGRFPPEAVRKREHG